MDAGIDIIVGKICDKDPTDPICLTDLTVNFAECLFTADPDAYEPRCSSPARAACRR